MTETLGGLGIILSMAQLVRLVIYAKDIQCIRGCSERSARRLLQSIRERLGKEKHQDVSVTEFCAYTGLREEEVREFVRS